MKTRLPSRSACRASALIIVLWVALGLVVITVYFGQSMNHELQASENRLAALAADQAIFGAARYVTNILARVTTPGEIPETNSYRCVDVPIGEARVWMMGRNDRQYRGENYAWGLVDEGSKLNLNSVTSEMLQQLPQMTPELAAAIIDWRDANSDISENGAESETYARFGSPYTAKNSNYESVAELRLVAGVDLDVLFGEDANLNGLLDHNENDSQNSLPFDNNDGRLDPGLMEYFTVYTRIPTLGTNINDRASLLALLQTKLGNRADQITITPPGGGQASFSNLLQFYFTSGLTRDEMAQVEGFLVCTNATNALININTAPEAVLACVPGIGIDLAPQLVAYRQTNPTQLNTLAWIQDALGWNAQEHRQQIAQAGPWICGRAFQFTADLAAVGRHGRGYKRVKYVFDVADGYARVRQRQDLTYLGWALGRQVRDSLALASNLR